jgi:hypothetical protein
VRDVPEKLLLLLLPAAAGSKLENEIALVTRIAHGDSVGIHYIVADKEVIDYAL